MIAVLWGAGPAVTQENKMTDTKKPNTLPSVLTYDDVRAVSPALEYYTKGPLLDGLWKRPDLSPRDRSVVLLPALRIIQSQVDKLYRTPATGALKFDTNVKDAEVHIDGAYAGTVEKLKTMNLRPGSYDTEVRAPGRTQFDKKVYVAAGKTLHLNPDLRVRGRSKETREMQILPRFRPTAAAAWLV